MIDFIEVCSRAFTGPLMPESRFDKQILYPAVKEIVQRWDIKEDLKNPINTDDEKADAVFHAGVDLLAEVGIYSSDTQRLIKLSREEIFEAISEAPGPCSFGEGLDAGIFSPRKPEDDSKPWCHVGGGMHCSSDEIAFKVVEAYARIGDVNSISMPTIDRIRSIPIVTGSPIGILSTVHAIGLVRAALTQAGRPGLPINNCIPTAGSAVETLAASHPAFGLRPTDGWLVSFSPELKVSFDALNRSAALSGIGARIGSQGAPTIGSYCGGPAGVAIANVAYSIAGIIVIRGAYHSTFPMDIHLNCSSTRGVLWAVSISSQAISRNLNYPIINCSYMANGPMTEKYYYEAAAYILGAISSGVSVQSPIAHKGTKADYQTPMEAFFTAKAIQASRKKNREEANELVNRLLEQYEQSLSSPEEGKTYQDCFDLKTGYPTIKHWELYGRVRNFLAQIGFPLPD